jgi:integrase
MIVRIRGVKRTRVKGRLYFYHRATKTRITAPPGTAAFAAEVAKLDQTGSRRPGVERATWGALVAAYRKSPEFAGLAERTSSDYQKVFDYLAALDRMPITQLDGPAVIAIRDRAFAQRKRRFTNHVLQVLSTVLNWGQPRKLSAGYPLAGHKRIKIPRPEKMRKANRPWTDAECDVVLNAATGGLKRGVALGMFACMRIGDAARVTWSIYDGTNLEWRQGKTGDEVWVPADPELRALLDGARTAATIVTGVSGHPLTTAGLAKAFRTLIKSLETEGLVQPGLTFHGMRHTKGKNLADLGADPRMIQALLGHRSMAASLHYSNEASRRRAATAAVELFAAHRAKHRNGR